MQLILRKTSFGSWWGLLILLATISASSCDPIDELFPKSPSMSLQEGDACRTLSDEPGVCTLILDCGVYLQALRSKTMSYKSLFRCGFVRADEVICCPLNTPTIVNEINPVTRSPLSHPSTSTTTIRPLPRSTQSWGGTITTTRSSPGAVLDWRLFADNSIFNKPDIIIYEVPSQNTHTQTSKRPFATRWTTPPTTSTKTGQQLSSAQLWEQFRRTIANISPTIRPQVTLTTIRPQTNWAQSRGPSRDITTTTTKRPQASSRTIRPQTNGVQGSPQRPPQPTAAPSNMRPSQAYCLQLRALYSSSGDADIFKRTQVPVGVFAHVGDLIRVTDSSSEGEFFCESSLIAERYVLTVANCVDNESARPTVARFGKTSWHPGSDTVVDYEIKDFFIHPDYHSGSYYNDIAIVELRRGVLFSVYIRPGCLYTHKEDISPTVPLTAIGLIEDDTVMISLASTTISVDSCNSSYKSFGVARSYKNGIAKGHYCVIDETSRNRVCEGDSAAPLQLVQDNEITTVGILLFGKLCGSSLPTVYSRVAFYLDWIERIVWPRGP